MPIRIGVFDHEKSGRHVLMGQCETTVNSLVEAYLDENGAKCMNLETHGKQTGKLFIEMAEVALPEGDPNLVSTRKSVLYKYKPTFVDYMNGGCGIRVVVGIDYSAFNGHPRHDDSLHHLDADCGDNDYQVAIKSIVGILAKYDEDQRFPVFGFGATINGSTSTCFQCGDEAEVEGVDGVLKAYKAPFKSDLTMSRTTDYTEIIRVADDHARQMHEVAGENGKQSYTVLLIITSGIDVDIAATVDALKATINDPISVIFVGVGEANFSEMEYLDEALKDHGRDLVNFVHFNKYRNNIRALTSATLNEIPDQLVGYFQSRDIEPLPPVEVDEESIAVEEEEAEIDLRFAVDGYEVTITGGEYNSFDAYVP